MEFTTGYRVPLLKEAALLAAIVVVGTTTSCVTVGLALDRKRVIASEVTVDEFAREAARFAATGEPIPNDRDISNFVFGTSRMSYGKLHNLRVERVNVSRKGPRIDVTVIAEVDPVARQYVGQPNAQVVGRGTATR
jgi:hypothetical protein